MTLSNTRHGAGRDQFSTENQKGRGGVSSILNIIREADRGQLMEDANIAIEDIMVALGDDYERSGEVTIKVKFTTKNGAVQIMPTLDHKLSKPERLPTIMFLDESGGLTRRDPRQPVMPTVVEADEMNRRRGGQTPKDE